MWDLNVAGKREVYFHMKAYFHCFPISYEDGVRTCFQSVGGLFICGEYYNFWNMLTRNELERGFF